MAVPKRKTSKSRKNMRRSHHALDKTTTVENNKTGTMHRLHHVSEDGYYKGRQVTTDKVNL